MLWKTLRKLVSIGSKTITNLRFAEDIAVLPGKEEELFSLVNQLKKVSKAYGMEVSSEKTKFMTNNTSKISSAIRVGGQSIETVKSFT